MGAFGMFIYTVPVKAYPTPMIKYSLSVHSESHFGVHCNCLNSKFERIDYYE